jgi:UDPglucose 6-dehydrogenase
LRQGSAVQNWLNPARIVIGGQSPDAVQTAEGLYAGIDAPVVRTDSTTAKMIKYASNALLVTRISFINEIAMLSEKVGSHIDDIAYGLSLDPRIGPSYLGAGIGWGGSCFPKDAKALEHLASAHGNKFDLLTAVISVNDRQRMLPLTVLKKVFTDLDGLPVTIMGLTFKPGTDDLRDAPAIPLIQALFEEGAKVRAYDPMGNDIARSVLPEGVRLFDDPLEAVHSSQAVIIATEWPEIVELPWGQAASLMEEPRFVFDGRNALDMKQMLSLGFQYQGVGRKYRLDGD